MDMKTEMDARILVLAVGLAGMSGVMALAAVSRGGGSRNLAAIAAISLAHGSALLVLGLLGHCLFPGTAPLGGVAMILGWLIVAVAGALGSQQSG
ncbi:MAG: hypothetical protein MO846_01350 [Candidatus Devosia symbiotica]|nr:hypothetical protein [Candidatus Devosia symbiotica]